MFKPCHKTPGTGVVAISLLFVFFGLIIFPSLSIADVIVVPTALITPNSISVVVRAVPKYKLNTLPVALDVFPIKIAVQVVPDAKSKIVITPLVIKKLPEARLLIPSIMVDAAIKDMGTTLTGEMAVPGNHIDVGWYSPGTRPGEIGSAVIGGHNVWTGKAGVFEHLDRLVKGDILTVVNAQGMSSIFTVTEMRDYNPTDDGTDIFQSFSGTHLNLITCSGVWDTTTKSYTKRLVIFADLVAG